VNLTAGIGYYSGDGLETTSFDGFPFPVVPIDTRHTNAYVYADVNPLPSLTVTAGLSHDDFNDGLLDRGRFNPKFGVTWVVDSNTTIRGAAFRVFERTLISSQTIEPTQVAGFNQFFTDANGTDSRRYGLAVDRRLGRTMTGGAEVTLRNLHVPATDVETGMAIDSERQERQISAYLNATPARWLAVTTQYRFERLSRDPAGNNEGLLARSRTHRIILEGRAFARYGLFSGMRLSLVDQDGEFQNAFQIVVPGSDRFWTLDGSLGYRLPRRRGIAALDVRNLFDSSFQFQDISPEEPTILSARQVTARFTLAF
jgi:hypothetical protein